MHARHILLLASIVIPIFGAPVVTNDISSIQQRDADVTSNRRTLTPKREPITPNLPTATLENIINKIKRGIAAVDTLNLDADDVDSVDQAEMPVVDDEDDEDDEEGEVDSSNTSPDSLERRGRLGGSGHKGRRGRVGGSGHKGRRGRVGGGGHKVRRGRVGGSGHKGRRGRLGGGGHKSKRGLIDRALNYLLN